MKFRTVLIWLLSIIGAFGLGFLIFNFLIMPRIVGVGKNVTVPDLTGKPLIEAQKILLSDNFDLGEVRQVYDTIFPHGYVVGQKPLAGSTVKTGRRVNLLVSKGPMIVNVPFLTQMSLSQGMKILSSLGVTSTAVESLRSSTIPPGKIIGTEPGPGLDIPLGTQLKIYVSSGMSGIFLMPSLVGLLTNIAIDSVSYNGLILGNIQTIPSDEEQGLVIIQYPEDGMKVKTGDTVRLIVSQGRR